MEYKDVVMKRYAARAFTGQKAPEEKIDELIDLIRMAPSALNLQPWKIKVIRDQATREMLGPAVFGQTQAVNCSHLLVLCANTDVEDVLAKAEKSMKEAGVPAEWLAHAMGMATQIKANLTPAWAQQQVFFALSNAVYGAKSLGLDSCPMTGFDPAQVSRVLGLPAHLVPTALCPVGYAADAPMPKARLSRSDFLI